MRLDPNQACRNDEQRFWWAFVHDFVAHPLMALSLWSDWSLKFHDWTSRNAWPRGDSGSEAFQINHTFAFSDDLWRTLPVTEFSPGFWEIAHPLVTDHILRTNASSAEEAGQKARAHFQDLMARFGAQFGPPKW